MSNRAGNLASHNEFDHGRDLSRSWNGVMTDPIIHQLYCTHCTYGTSALHRHTGNIKDQPFEYSTRAGSIEQSESHQRFQQFEKLYFRGLPLPSDTPTERRQNLTAASSPWRRLVAAGIPEGSLLAHVAYRATDTSKPPRTGSYFAHLLLHNPVEPTTERRWSLTDALQMWGAEFWVVEDGDDLQHELKTVSDLRQLPGFGKVINDGALLSFLTTPQDGVFNDGPASPSSEELSLACAIPQRWRQRPVEDRLALFTSLIQSVLNLNLNRRERLSLAIEPSLAALLFYGVIRLLPRTGLVDQLSVSTFEPHTEASSLVLTATDFYYPATSDLLPAAYRGGVAINTHNSKPLPASPPTPYVSTMLGKLLASGKEPDAVDRLRDELRSNGLTKIPDCEQYLGVEDLAEGLVQPNPSNAVSERDLSGLTLDVARQKLRQLVLDRLRVLPEDDEIWSALRKSPPRVTLIAHVLCEEPALAQRDAVLEQLCACLPDTELPLFFKDRQIPAELRRARLKHEVEKTTGELPADWDELWLPVKSGEAAERPLLEQLFVELDAGRLESFCQSVVESAAIKRDVASDRVLTMLTYLAKAAKQSLAEKRDILTQLLRDARFEEEHWYTLLRHHELRSQLFEVYPADEQFLRERLVGLLNHLRNSGRKFPSRCDILKAAEARLPTDRRTELRCWLQVKSHIQELNEVQEVPIGLFDRLVTGTRKRKLQKIGASLALDCQRMLRDQYGCPTKESQLRALSTFVRANSVSGKLPKGKAFLHGLDQALGGTEEPVARVRDKQVEDSFVSWALAWLLYTLAILAMASVVMMVGATVFYNRNPDFFKQPMTASEKGNSPADDQPSGRGKSKEKGKQPSNRRHDDIKTGMEEQQKTPPAGNTVADNPHTGSPQEDAVNTKKKTTGVGPDNAASNTAKIMPLTPAANPPPKGDPPTGDGKGVISPNDSPSTKLRGPTWNPDKLYEATNDGINVIDKGPKFWKMVDTNEPIEFLSLHGPYLQLRHDLKPVKIDSDTWPLVAEWTNDKSVRVFTYLPNTDGVPRSDELVLLWELLVDDRDIVGKRSFEFDDDCSQKLATVLGRIQESWSSCVLGIHPKIGDAQFRSFDANSIRSDISQSDSMQLVFKFREDKHPERPNDGRLWAIGGNGSVRLGDHILEIGNGDPKMLFSGKWQLPDWPSNQVAPSADITISNGTAVIDITIKREFKQAKDQLASFFDASRVSADRVDLADTLDSSAKGLRSLVIKADDLTEIKPGILNEKVEGALHMKSTPYKAYSRLCDYFGKVPVPSIKLSDNKDKAAAARDNRFNWNSVVLKFRAGLDEMAPKKEAAAIEAIRDGIKDKVRVVSIVGSVYRVTGGVIDQEKENDNGGSEKKGSRGRITKGIAVKIAEFRTPIEYGEGKK